MWQIRRALKGSDVMLIHLGKHYCGQIDKNVGLDDLDDAIPHDEHGNPIDV